MFSDKKSTFSPGIGTPMAIAPPISAKNKKLMLMVGIVLVILGIIFYYYRDNHNDKWVYNVWSKCI